LFFKTRILAELMNYTSLFNIFLVFCLVTSLQAQQTETEIKVYDFDDGLSHRNVFQITQDQAGLIWLATINGLNRFDGYQFKHFSSKSKKVQLPTDIVSDLARDPEGTLMLASPDYLTRFSPKDYSVRDKQIKAGEIVRRESLAPNNLCFAFNQWWCTVYDEKNGQNWLANYKNDKLQLIRKLESAHTNRPLVWWQNKLFFVQKNNELVQLDQNGKVVELEKIGSAIPDNLSPRIVDMTIQNDALYILLNDSRLFVWKENEQEPEEILFNNNLPQGTRVGALCVAEDGGVWLGGLGELWFYDNWSGEWSNYDAPIRQLVKNTCTYRQIFLDASNTLWLATNFGAIKVTHFDHLFT